MSTHAPLAPSSAARRVQCPGSRALEEMYPEDQESQAAKDGTAAHWAVAEMLAGRTIDTGQIAPNGVMLTDEMVEGAELMTADVRATDAEFVGYTLHVEETLSIATINPLCWGTPDTWRFKPYKLIIWDYKFGHRRVDVFENWQVIEYAAGALEAVGINGVSDHRTQVEFRIVQPRCYSGGPPITTWSCMASELRGYFNALRLSEAKSLEADAPCIVGPECRDCRARHACRSAQSAAYASMDVAYSNVPFDLPPDALGAELRYVDRAIAMLEARRTGLAEQTLSLLKRGVAVPFYRAEPSQGRERWAKPDEEIKALGRMLGVPIVKEKPITPKQAIDAGVPVDIVKSYAEIPIGETKLKADDGTQARKVFSNS
ncbi:MAG: DUF2800 domain-containing protein [Methylocystis sp.]|uniref:DUF2800 domain-containing protein n=1 Tax=Methylocystis sp. TaxID=1911079 RepID=UPI003DA5332B